MSQRWSTPIAINAMSVNMPTVAEHPNRHPFSGTLTRLDEPSDGAPHGSQGRRVLLTRAGGERALPSLLGMGVNVAVGMNGHAAQRKIGVITGAHVVGNEIQVSGFLYAADFPQEVARIRAETHLLGMSFECRNLDVADPNGDPLVINGCAFTGASILRKAVAAYRTTSLAASADTARDERVRAIAAEVARQLTPMVAKIVAVMEAQLGQTRQTAAMRAAHKR